MDETARTITDLSAVEDQIAGMSGGDLLTVLVRRRGALRKKIAPVHLAAYDALERFRRRPVVVPVRRSHCGGCQLRVPPQIESLLRRNRTLISCPHCHRLLYFPAGETGRSAERSPSATGGAAPEIAPPAAAPVRAVSASRRRKREPRAAPIRASRR
jgi:hypothetical protein